MQNFSKIQGFMGVFRVFIMLTVGQTGWRNVADLFCVCCFEIEWVCFRVIHSIPPSHLKHLQLLFSSIPKIMRSVRSFRFCYFKLFTWLKRFLYHFLSSNDPRLIHKLQKCQAFFIFYIHFKSIENRHNL